MTREIAARSRSPRWPANDWVMTVRENMARRLKMVGPAMCQIFFDSAHVCLTKFASSSSSSCPPEVVGSNRGSYFISWNPLNYLYQITDHNPTTLQDLGMVWGTMLPRFRNFAFFFF